MLVGECCLYVPLKTASIVISCIGLVCSLGLLGSSFLFIDTRLQLNLPPIIGLLITNIFLIYSTKKEIYMLILPCLIMQIMLSTFLWYVKYSRYVVDFLTASFHIMILVCPQIDLQRGRKYLLLIFLTIVGSEHVCGSGIARGDPQDINLKYIIFALPLGISVSIEIGRYVRTTSNKHFFLLVTRYGDILYRESIFIEDRASMLLAYVWFIIYCYYYELKHREIPKTYIEFEPVELRAADANDEDKECDTSLLV